MKYAYKVSIEGNHKNNHYVEIFFDRVLFHGTHYHGNTSTPKVCEEFMDSISKVKGVSGDFVKVEGSQLQVSVCPFNIAKTVKILVKRVQRRFAKGESRQRIPFEEMNSQALSLNITKEIQACDIFIEAAKILPNQDPIRLAAGLKDLNLPPKAALKILRSLANHFKGYQSDPIRLVSGYNTILEMVKKS